MQNAAQEVAISLTPSLILFIGICRFFVKSGGNLGAEESITASWKRRDAPGRDGADGANCGRMAEEQALP
jgi:hypothetical protein